MRHEEIEIEVEKKLNGGSHIFGLKFDTLADAENTIKALKKSSDIIDAKLTETK